MTATLVRSAPLGSGARATPSVRAPARRVVSATAARPSVPSVVGLRPVRVVDGSVPRHSVPVRPRRVRVSSSSASSPSPAAYHPSASSLLPRTSASDEAPERNRRGPLALVARLAAGVAACVAWFMFAPRAASAAVAKKEVAAAAVEAATKITVDWSAAWGSIVGTVAMLVAYAFFCTSETAITTLWPWKVREISDQEGPDSPFTLMRKDINRFLTTILIGSTVTSIGSATLAAQAAMLLYGEESIALCTAALTLVTLIFCEIAPKSIAVQNAAAVARVVIRPIAAMSTLVYPIGRLCTNLVNAVFAVFNIKIAAEPFVSEEELKLVLSGAAKSGQVDSGEKEMIQNVLDMSETPVREVMTPLVRVVGVEQSTSLVELQKIWRTHRFSRVPVYADRVDNIVGVVYSMRLLEYELKQELLSTIKVENLTQKPPYYVPESMSVVKLMRELLARKTHMAIVVNEHGGVVGIATFEDCVEEIVGEIYDENDRPDESEINDDYIRQVAHDVYDVDCRAFVDDLAESIGIDIPSSALYDTVGGFTCDCFDRIPNVGETMVVHMASASKNYDDDSQDEDEPSNFGSRGRSFSDTTGDEGEKADFCAVRPVRITVLDGGMKILRKVQIRVNDAARLKEVIDGQTGAPSRMLGAGGGDDSRIDENREPSVDEVTVDDRTETWQPSR